MGMHNRQWSPHSDYVKHEAFKWLWLHSANMPYPYDDNATKDADLIFGCVLSFDELKRTCMLYVLSTRWYKSKTAAVPEDPEAFFRWFFTQQEGWGLAMSLDICPVSTECF